MFNQLEQDIIDSKESRKRIESLVENSSLDEAIVKKLRDFKFENTRYLGKSRSQNKIVVSIINNGNGLKLHEHWNLC